MSSGSLWPGTSSGATGRNSLRSESAKSVLGEAPTKAGSPGGRSGSPVCTRPRRVRSREQALHWSGPKRTQGLPWWSRGSDSVLPMKGAQVQSLVRELRFHIPRSAPQKKCHEKQTNRKPDESSLRSVGAGIERQSSGVRPCLFPLGGRKSTWRECSLKR